MLRTATAATAALITFGLISAPTANASCGLHTPSGHVYNTACLNENRSQAVKDIRRVQRYEMGKKIADKILGKPADPSPRPRGPRPHGIN